MQKILMLALGVFSVFGVQAQQIPTLDFFHGRECPHCHREREWFPTLKQAYPDIVINEYEVWHDAANQKLWGERLAELDMKPTSVPTNIVGDTVVTGFQADAILAALAQTYGVPALPLESLGEVSVVEDSKEGFNYRILVIVLAGLALAGGVFYLGKK